MQEVIKNIIDQIGLYRQVVPNKFTNKFFFKLKKIIKKHLDLDGSMDG